MWTAAGPGSNCEKAGAFFATAFSNSLWKSSRKDVPHATDFRFPQLWQFQQASPSFFFGSFFFLSTSMESFCKKFRGRFVYKRRSAAGSSLRSTVKFSFSAHEPLQDSIARWPAERCAEVSGQWTETVERDREPGRVVGVVSASRSPPASTR